MKHYIKKVADHPFISGSVVVVAGAMIANILNYLFNLAVGRMLLPADYGEYAALISIFNILAIFSGTILIVFAKFAAVFMGKNEKEKIPHLLQRGSLFTGVIALIICTIALIATPWIAEFIHTSDTSLIFLVIASIFVLYISSVPLGILQGSLHIVSLSVVNIVSSFSKLFFGVLFIVIGLKAFGGILAFFVSIIIGLTYGTVLVMKFFKNDDNKVFRIPTLRNDLFKYGLPVFWSGLGMTMVISQDILLVKHYFNDLQAGQYAALSLMGRSIFYVVQPITTVFFSIVAQKKEKNEGLTNTMLLGAFLIGGPTVLLSIIYFLFPGVVIKIFFPAPEYASLAQYLGLYSLFIAFFSLASLLNSFFLSIGKTVVLFFGIGAAILEVVLLMMFHGNLLEVTYSLIATSFVLLLVLLIYYIYIRRVEDKHILPHEKL